MKWPVKGKQEPGLHIKEPFGLDHVGDWKLMENELELTGRHFRQLGCWRE